MTPRSKIAKELVKSIKSLYLIKPIQVVLLTIRIRESTSLSPLLIKFLPMNLQKSRKETYSQKKIHLLNNFTSITDMEKQILVS